MAIIRDLSSKPLRLKIPSRSQCLHSWCLPMMASSIEADEEEQRSLALFNSVKKLAEMQAKKGAAAK